MAENLDKLIQTALEDLKGQDLKVLDVRELSDVMDTLIIVTGTSNRHVKSLADNVISSAKEQGIRAIGIEGVEAADWVLVDFGDIVVHVMLEATRDFYELEKLWSLEPTWRKNKS